MLANLYIAELDDLVCTMCPFLKFWKRYIDDAFGFVSGTSEAGKTCKSILDSWRPSIQWDISGEGARVAFLDLDIQLDAGRLRFQTYRKPKNAYLYIPKISCHPDGVFNALIVGESQRLFRHNRRNPVALEKHLQYFLCKLQLRGYNRQNATRLIRRTISKLQRREPQKTVKSKSFFFKQIFTSTLDRRYVKRALCKHWHIVQTCFHRTVAPVLSFRVQKNSFRRNFASNWLNASPSMV